MDYKNIYEGKDLGEVSYDSYLKDYTTFGIGGRADVLLKPQNEDQLKNILRLNKNMDIKTTVIGRGSNLLVSDKGIRGAVVVLADNYSKLGVKDEIVTALAGTSLNETALFAIENSLRGMEEISGIPGSIGGAVAMNAGAYGGEIKDICLEVRTFDYDGNIHVFTNEQMNFSYRHSRIFEQDLIVSSASFKLKKADKQDLLEKYEDFTNRRQSKQPLDKKSAGSTFKRPVGSYASKLIDECGLRGFRQGDAQVSEKHCGFLINRGEATCKQMLDFINEVSSIVYEKTGFKLEREVKLIGEL
ncbi:MAG: UDP-N-acetylmuramate dehydrogenase [Anaerococcus sp.]|nr:UDP-N-acetylmuramate dehydrogenase [Anaerococcus sp.]